MIQQKRGIKPAIRYSEAFKMQVVRELETELAPAEQVRRKYGIGSGGTIQEWLAKYGNGTRGKVIRVETAKEIDQLKKLKERVQRLETALADANIELVLAKAYTHLACERAGITDVEGFKKKAAGQLPTTG
jgi:transposase-like protein